MVLEKTKEERAEYMDAIADVLVMMISQLGVKGVLDDTNFDDDRRNQFLGFMVTNFDKRGMVKESDYIKKVLEELGAKSLEEMNIDMNFDPSTMLTSIHKRLKQ